jgi:hypothetical protein
MSTPNEIRSATTTRFVDVNSREFQVTYDKDLENAAEAARAEVASTLERQSDQIRALEAELAQARAAS